MTLHSAPPERQGFALRLRETRARCGFKTARSFALSLGIDENRYTRYERAEVEPDITLIVQICRALNVTADDLLGFEHAQSNGLATAQNGFAEPIASGFRPTDNAHPASAANHATGAIRMSSFSLTAWQLAEEVAALVPPTTDNSQVGPLAQIAAKTVLYTEMIADPFQAIAKLTQTEAIAAADEPTQARIAALADQLVAHAHTTTAPPPR